MTDADEQAEAHLRRLTHHWNSDANDDLRAIARVLAGYESLRDQLAVVCRLWRSQREHPTHVWEPVGPELATALDALTAAVKPARYSTPFANGTEVDWFRANRCDRCVHDHPDGGGCDEFALGVVVEGGWATDGRLIPVDRSPSNPLGVECQRFQCHHDGDLVPGTGNYCGTCGTYASGPTDRDDPTDAEQPAPVTTPTEEAHRG